MNRLLAWKRNHDVWDLWLGDKTIAGVYRLADGWHAIVPESRKPGSVFGWIGEIRGLFKTRRKAMHAAAALLSLEVEPR